MVVNHFHLQVPKRRSVLPQGARTRTCEARLSRSTYLYGAWKAQFFLDGNDNPPNLPLPDQAWYRISAEYIYCKVT